MSAEEKFRIETFYPILDRIVADLKNRLCAYSETDARFLFLRHHELENSVVKDSLFRLTSFCSDDLDAEIFDEWLQWTEFEKTQYPKDASRRQAHEMLSTLKKHHVESAFQNIFIALRIYLTLPVSNCWREVIQPPKENKKCSPLDNGSRTFITFSNFKHRIRTC